MLPTCQDTGTAISFGKKGQFVLTDFDEEEALAEGIYEAYQKNYLRYSQLAPLEMFNEVNTKNNLPAQCDIMATKGDEYNLMFIAKGGGSANKMYFYQATPAVLNEADLSAVCCLEIERDWYERLPTLSSLRRDWGNQRREHHEVSEAVDHRLLR